jgi:Na+-driven multidrug efflux pump
MCALLLGAILNIGLDPIFIYVLEMGVAGAAIATAISQLVSTLVYLNYVLRKKSAFTFSVREFAPTKQMMAEIENRCSNADVPASYQSFYCTD